MKKIYLLILVVSIAVLSGCSDKPARAQALLLEALDYSGGASREKALQYAATKGYKSTDRPGGLTDQEIVLNAGREKCKEILAQYPTTPAAIRAAELKSQLDQQLRGMANARIQSLYANPNE